MGKNDEPINEENNQQELIMKFGMFEQQLRQIQENIHIVDQNINELASLRLNLDNLKSKEGEEILAQVGRGIFIKSKILSEDLIVDIGGKNYVKKTIEETKEIIGNQLEKLEKVKGELMSMIEGINQEINEMIIHTKNNKE